MIIRGHNYYPQDIEQTVAACHEALIVDGGAAFSVEREGEEQVVIVQELNRHMYHLDLDALMTTIRQAVAGAYQLQMYAIVLIKAGHIPKTSSGKIQHHMCRELFLLNRLEVIHSSIIDQELPRSNKQEDFLTRDMLLATSPAQRLPLLERSLLIQVAQMLDITPEQLRSCYSLSELGLDSLAAIELLQLFETRLAIVLPMTTFLEDFTISQVAAELLRQITDALETGTNSFCRDVKSEHKSPVVSVQPTGSKGPLFVVHPLSGFVRFAKLGRLLGPDQPLYGLQARGLEGEQKPHTDVESMASDYVVAVCELQPKGPYLLAGVCVGGIVAFEMAQQLHAQGHQVSLLALLDTINITMVQQLRLWEQTVTIQTLQDSINDLEKRKAFLATFNTPHKGGLTRVDYEKLWPVMFRESLSLPPTSLDYLRNLETEEEQIRFLLEELGRNGTLHYSLRLPHATDILKVRKSNTLALMNYVPRPYPNHITLFRSRETAAQYPEEPEFGWRDLAGGGIKAYDIPTGHDAMFINDMEPFVRQLRICLLESQS
jgi:acyl carrier protein